MKFKITDLRNNPSRNEDGDYIDPIDIISDDNTTDPVKDIFFRTMLDLLKENLDELGAEIIYYKYEKNMTFDEVSKILNINSNSLRTKVSQIRLNHNKYKDLTWE